MDKQLKQVNLGWHKLRLHLLSSTLPICLFPCRYNISTQLKLGLTLEASSRFAYANPIGWHQVIQASGYVYWIPRCRLWLECRPLLYWLESSSLCCICGHIAGPAESSGETLKTMSTSHTSHKHEMFLPSAHISSPLLERLIPDYAIHDICDWIDGLQIPHYYRTWTC